MNSVSFRAFVKEAAALQADEDTPPDYVETRAAVEAMFPKLAVSAHWVAKKVRSGAAKASPERLRGFANRMAGTGQTASMSRDHHDRISGIKRLGASNLAVYNMKKQASGGTLGNVAELAGLGTLAAPAAVHLATKGKKEWSEKAKARAEVGGLGILAAPYAHSLAKKSKHYSNLSGRIGKALSRGVRAAA